MANNHFSISRKLTDLVIFSFVFSVVVFIAVHLCLNMILDNYFNSERFINLQNQKVIERLERYIRDEKVSSTDREKLSRWAAKDKYVVITIFKDGFLVYDSAYSKAEEKEYFQEKQRLNEKLYAREVTFTDGKAEILIYDFHVLKYYNWIFIAEFIGSCSLFFVFVLKGIKGKIVDIQRLNDEIHIMEGGNLEFHIRHNGNDELAQLAESVEALRKSFKEKLELVDRLQQERRNLVTEMAHDMRTPLTAILMYLGFAKNETSADQEDLQRYVNKAYNKAKYIKSFSDKMFDYFLLDANVEIVLELVSFEEALYDRISDFVSYLYSSGFSVTLSPNFPDVCIQMNKEYISRILNNCMSNMIKYANREVPIQIVFIEVSSAVEIHVVNGVNRAGDADIESTMLGNRIIEKMMTIMHGKCLFQQDQDRYESILIFPIVEKYS